MYFGYMLLLKLTLGVVWEMQNLHGNADIFLCSTRVYQPADTPGYFDGHVWPMYLKYKNELEENTSNVGMVSLILNL